MTSTVRLSAALVLLAASFLLWANLAAAQQVDPPHILIIDVQRIMRESTAVQSIQEQLQERRGTLQNELSQRERDLRSAEQVLAEQRTSVSAEEFAQLRREFEEQVGAFQRESQSRRRALDQLFNESMQKVQAALVETVQRIASERQADIVLAKPSVVLVRPEFEITEQALKELNEAMPSFEVPQSID